MTLDGSSDVPILQEANVGPAFAQRLHNCGGVAKCPLDLLIADAIKHGKGHTGAFGKDDWDRGVGRMVRRRRHCDGVSKRAFKVLERCHNNEFGPELAVPATISTLSG